MMKLIYCWSGTQARLENPIAWVSIVVKNVCIDIHRQNSRRAENNGFLNSDAGLFCLDNLVVVDERLPYQEYESKEAYWLLIKCIQKLPDSVMQVALMRFRDELNYKEIAESLGIREDAARKRVEYARKQFVKEPGVLQFYDLRQQ